MSVSGVWDNRRIVLDTNVIVSASLSRNGNPAKIYRMFLAAIRRHGKEIWPFPSIHAMIDEDDRVFYDAAKDAGAYLITGNTKHYPNEPFILTPAAFLQFG